MKPTQKIPQIQLFVSSQRFLYVTLSVFDHVRVVQQK
jgi:hypothetical protein